MLEIDVELRLELFPIGEFLQEAFDLVDYEFGNSALMWHRTPTGLFWPLPQTVHLDTPLDPGGPIIFAVIVVLYGTLSLRVYPSGHKIIDQFGAFMVKTKPEGEFDDCMTAFERLTWSGQIMQPRDIRVSLIYCLSIILDLTILSM